jgi:hypothetical protein
MAEKIDLIDGHGISYRYSILTTDALWSDDSGVFLFAKPNEHGWQPIFVSHCDSFRQHIPGHSSWGKAAKLGAANIFMTVIDDPKERERHARSLATLLEPVMNKSETEVVEDAELSKAG